MFDSKAKKGKVGMTIAEMIINYNFKFGPRIKFYPYLNFKGV